MARNLLFGMLTALAATVPVSARQITRTLPVENVLKIQARVGDDAAFVGTVTLDSAEKATDITFRSSDLVGPGGERIRGPMVTMTGPTKFDLAGKTPRDVDVKVAGIKTPGVYSGTLYFLLPTQAAANAFSVPIEVTATSVPKLTPRKGSESLKLQLVNCAAFGCTIARWLQPGVSIRAVEAVFDNETIDSFKATVDVSAVGDTHRGSIGDALKPPQSITVEATPIFKLPIALNRSPSTPLLADHYVGDVQVRAAGPAPLVRIPLEVNVRSGPMLPMLMIFLGILLGRLVKFMNDRGNTQADLLASFYRLETQADDSPPDRQLLDAALSELRQHIYQMKLDDATAELAAVSTRWQHLRTWRAIENTLASRRGDTAVDAILLEIENGRAQVAARQDAEVAAIAGRLAGAVAALGPLEAMRAPRGVQAIPLPGPQPLPWYRRWLANLAGIRAELTLWLVRPLLYILLLVGLVVVGVMQLYVKNLTFGADPVGDYFGLLVWGLSADVAGRTLATLKT